MGEEGAKDHIRWLTVILSVAGIVILILAYMLWTPDQANRFGRLVESAIPSAVVVLAAIPVVYFLFEIKGIQFNASTSHETDVIAIADAVVTRLNAEDKSTRLPELRAFHDTYRNVNWKALIGEASVQIDIVVYYFDSWVNANYEIIVQFFRKPGTRMRVFVANPEDDTILANVNRLFPEYTKDEARSKVERTGTRLSSALKDAGGDMNRLEFYYFPHVLNYSIQVIDSTVLVLSIYEMSRQKKIDSPAIVIDLKRSPHLAKYWQKELDGLLSASKRVSL